MCMNCELIFSGLLYELLQISKNTVLIVNTMVVYSMILHESLLHVLKKYHMCNSLSLHILVHVLLPASVTVFIYNINYVYVVLLSCLFCKNNHVRSSNLYSCYWDCAFGWFICWLRLELRVISIPNTCTYCITSAWS